MRSRVGDLLQFVEDLAAPGIIDTFVLLGMGGSSLAPEVIKRTFDASSFEVLDTTHPAALRHATETLDFDATLFIAASKSGTTLETRSHLDYFWDKAGKRGEFFAAITDPGSELESLARERGFVGVFEGEPTIGGRYSALSVFGLVPAALMGVDLERLLERVEEMVEACHSAGGQSGPGARARARPRLAGRARQGDDQPEHGRLRALGRAAAGRVDREGGQGPDPRAGRVARRPRPSGAGGAVARPVRAGAGVLPLGVRDRGGGLDPRDQPVRPARRAGGEGQDERGPRRRRESRRGAARLARRAVRAGAAGRLRRGPGIHRPGSRGRSSSR